MYSDENIGGGGGVAHPCQPPPLHPPGPYGCYDLDIHHPTDRIALTTSFVIPNAEHWMEQEIGQ